jgi:hypothetical protein
VRNLRNEDGIAMVMAVSILIVLGMLGVVVTVYSTAGQRTASRSSAGVSAYSLAEAGINNAMSILAKQKNAGVATLLPSTLAAANTSNYDSGYVKWWGTYDTLSTTWTLSAIGYMGNPTGGSRQITRKITTSVKVRPKFMQPTSNPAWNYIIATRTNTPGGCDESLNNSVNIQSPLYVVGNLCLNTPSQITGGPLQVKGYMKLDVNTNVGSLEAPVNEVHVKNGCRYKTGAFVSPCTPTQKVWGGTVDANPIDLDLPTADFASWYVNAAPGPRQSCTTQSGTVPVFDNNTTWDAPNGSVPGVFNLVPSSSSYSCVVQSGSEVVGQLSWNHLTKTLTINGTVFIDGSVTVNYGYSNVPIEYRGTGTIYLGGTLLFANTQLCADLNAAQTACDFPSWQPNSRFLVFVANGVGGNGQQVPTGDSIQLVSSSFEGGLFGKNTIEANTTSRTQGPMFAGNEILDQTVYARTFPLIDVPVGMPGTIITEAPPDAPSGFTG